MHYILLSTAFVNTFILAVSCIFDITLLTCTKLTHAGLMRNVQKKPHISC